MTTIAANAIAQIGRKSIARMAVDAETKADFVAQMKTVLLTFPNATPRRVAPVANALWRQFHGLRFIYEAGDPIHIATGN